MPTYAYPEKKSKKKLILFIVIILILAGLGIIAYFLIPIITAPTQENLQSSFNTYSNYLLYGEKTDKSLDNIYEPSTTYYMEKILADSSTQEASSYYNELESLFANSLAKYNRLLDDDKLPSNITALSEALERHKLLLDFARKYAMVQELSEESLSEKYLTSGETGVQILVSDAYQSLADDKNDEVRKYGELRIEQFSSLINALNAYRDAGCIVSGKANNDCINTQASTNTAALENYRKFYEAKDHAHVVITVNRDDLLSGCWIISAELSALVGNK